MAVNRGMGLLLLATVSVSLLSAPRSPSPQKTDAAGGQAKKNKVDGNLSNLLPARACKVLDGITCGGCKDICPVDPLRETIESFFTNVEQQAAGSKGKKTGGLPSKLQAPENLSLKQVIAVVPDPRHTHLALFFDRSIDAIEQGAQSEKYVFDRASMPWDANSHPESDDIRLRNLAENVRDSNEEIPGLLIFRQPGDPDQRSALFIWVVGETPTGGIHKNQFRNALKFMRTLNSARGENIPLLSILGPTFSGSLYSLLGLLKENDAKFKRIQVQSGTVSSWQVSQWFLKWKPDNTDFKTFQESDEYAIRRFLEWVVLKRGYSASDVALLSEEETAYGSFEGTQPALAQFCPETWKPGVDIRCLRDEAVQLYFPRDISQLRSAYQRDLGGNANSSDRIIPRETLPLNLEDSSSDDDSVPTYSKVQTPLSQEAVMLGVVSNLEKHHSKFILIRSTNPLDQLFLARYLRVAYPQGRIVTSDADLLFQREMDSTLLHGILTISPYSLLPGSDDDVARPDCSPTAVQSSLPDCQLRHSHLHTPHADHVFPNAYAVGTYNATLSLLECIRDTESCKASPQDAFGKHDDLPLAEYAEYGWPKMAGPEDQRSLSMSPPLGLTVLGRSGYWSLGLLDVSDVPPLVDVSSNLHEIKCPVDRKNLVKKSISVPQPWALVCGVCCGVVFLFLALLTQGSVLSASEAMANCARAWVPPIGGGLMTNGRD